MTNAGGNPESLSTLEYASHTNRPRSRRGRGFLTVCGDLAMPGVGHFLAGVRRRAIFWFAVCMGIGLLVLVAASNHALTPAIIVLLPLSLLAQLAMLIDGYRVGRRSQHEMLRWPIARYAAGIGALALANFVSPSLRGAVWLRDHVVEAFVMPTHAMSPTIIPADRFLVHKRIGWQRWSLIVFDAPDSPGQKYVKRLVGLPGETVELVGDQVMINGSAVPLPAELEPFQSNPPAGPRIGCNGNPITLGKDEYFVLGDNSPMSADSRYWGTVPESNIIGVVTWTYWPPKRWRGF
jgi:signal peptidase I